MNAFSQHRATFRTKFFHEADRHGLEGIMAKRVDRIPVGSAER
jgi:ATP-dependent DNA ligase